MKISRVCRILGYSRQAYYSSIKGNCGAVHPELFECILSRRKQLPFEGIRKLYHYLKSNTEYSISRAKLEALLVDHELIISRPKRYRLLTDSSHNNTVSGNYLRGRKPGKVFELLVSDITYLKTRQREYYLTVIMDLYTRMLLSYYLSENLGTGGLLIAFKDVARRYGHRLQGSVFHSDRGSQYCSIAFRELTAEYGVFLSNSRSGNPYDNAVIERVFATLKNEYMLNVVYPDKISLSAAVKDAVNSYNNQRLHMSLNMMTPRQIFMAEMESY